MKNALKQVNQSVPRALREREKPPGAEVKIPDTKHRLRGLFAIHPALALALGFREVRAVQPIRNTEPKIGRNDPCPCGCGARSKECAGPK